MNLNVEPRHFHKRTPLFSRALGQQHGCAGLAYPRGVAEPLRCGFTSRFRTHAARRAATMPAHETGKSNCAALFGEPGVDLRDPKLSITPDDRLMIVAGGSVYEGARYVGRQPRVLFSPDGSAWSAPQRILAEGDWLWRVTWHESRAYGVTYKAQSGTSAEWIATLVSSADGRTFEPVTTFAVPGRPNETTLRVMPDGEMVALVRREAGDRLAWLGRSHAPYTNWRWRETPHQIGGPNFIRLPDGELWASGRSYPGGAKTVIGRLTLGGDYEPALTLPSGGDTSYAGMVWHEDVLWISYYASHEGKTAIYVARVKVRANQIRTASGLIYETVVAGTGAIARLGDKVRIHETLSLPDGKVIFNSREKNQTVAFVLGANQVIPGVDEGVTGMRAGERRRLLVPPSLDGRKFDPSFIPPAAIRHYDIELVEIVK